MNRGSASPRSRWRRSKFSAARIRLTCAAARGASFSTDYQLRIISRDAIGHDVNIPPLAISYRIHSRVGAAATLEGRDLSYVMPMMPIKVLSLVPADAVGHSRCIGGQPRRGGFVAVPIEPVPGPDA